MERVKWDDHVRLKGYPSLNPRRVYVVRCDGVILEDPNGRKELIPRDDFDENWIILTEQKQVGGSHYTDLAIQPLEVIRANKMGFLDGSALKYIMRFRGKNGVEDLKKAIHFCELLIEELENGER
jgi:hypothetical protein